MNSGVHVVIVRYRPGPWNPEPTGTGSITEMLDGAVCGRMLAISYV